VLHTPPIPISIFFITRAILGEQYRSLSSSLCRFYRLPCYLVPPRLKNSPQGTDNSRKKNYKKWNSLQRLRCRYLGAFLQNELVL
jgi:hypothetical protein